MKRLKLTKGKYALVDNEDYQFLSKLHWKAVKKENDWYAVIRKVIDGTHGRKQTSIYMHEFLIKLDSFDCITFKNKNTLDYRKDNLFGVSHGVKVSRRRKVKITTRGNIPTSKYKGVCIRRRNGIIVWEARVSKDDKTYYLGSYTSQRDAGRAYNEKARELYGEFAYQNKV